MTTKGKFISGLALSAVLVTGLFAVDKKGEERKPDFQNCPIQKDGKFEQMHHRGEHGILGIFKELNLTAEQKTKIQQIVADIRKNEITPDDAFTKDSFDKNKFISIMNDRRDNMIKSQAEIMEKSYEVLTAKQKEQLKVLMDLRKEKMQQRDENKNKGYILIKIAMIEDDLELANILTQYLKQFNMEVTNYEEPFLALSALKINKYDLVILDLTLPGMDGLDVCKQIVKNFDIPIIISSARSDITDKVTALQLGADDYLPKPYDPRELEVRIKTILRRFNHSNIQEEDTKNKLFSFDEEKKEITKNKKYIKLTAGEYEVLLLLLKREGFIVSRDDIFENSDILNQDYESSGSLAVIINRIRHKIEENPKEPQYLHTIRGMGYKFIQ